MKNKIKNNRLKFYIIAISLPLLQFLVFYVYVNFNSIMLAFKSLESGTSNYKFVGFDNFIKVISDYRANDGGMKQAMENTFKVFGITLLIKIVPVFMSYYLFKQYAMHGVFKVFLFIPQIVSSMALVILYRSFIDNVIPEIWKILFHKNIIGLYINSNTLWSSLIFFYVWFSLGSQFLLYAGAMSGISDSIIEAAELDGTNAFQEFLFIVFPMIYKTFVTFIVTSFAILFTYQLNLFSFGGKNMPSSVRTIGYLLYVKTLNAGMKDYPYLAAAGILLTIIVIPLCLLVKWLLTKIGPKTV